MNANHVIILGCGRSGTSIFGELFDHLSCYTYLSEPFFGELLKINYLKPIAVKVPRESPGFTPDPGLSFPLTQCLALFSGPKTIFWQIRHPLDTICSLKVGISKNWGHHPKPPDWQKWLHEPLIVRCAYHWNYINSVGFDQVKKCVKITRFEELISDPLQFAKNICRDVNIDTVSYFKDIKQWSDKVQNKNNEAFVEAMTSRAYSTKDHQVKVGRWKENMTKEEIDLVIPFIKDTASQFGYQLP